MSAPTKQIETKAMTLDFTSHKLLSFQAKAQQAKKEHKPSLSCKASMVAYQKTVGVHGKASFGIPSLAIDYVA